MSAGISKGPHNRILSLLPNDDAARLGQFLEPAFLDFKSALYEVGAPIRHVYFPLSGVVSWLALVDGQAAEVATIGNEGMVGIRTLLGGGVSTARVIVQVPGPALKLETARLCDCARPGSALLDLLYRYLNAFLTQITQSVACNALHPVEKRFCRWLLMTHDRVQSDHVPLTHELLAKMLGVRRASVTEAARRLQGNGLIRYTHGKITILDRPRLEAASCACYQAVRADYDALLPPPATAA